MLREAFEKFDPDHKGNVHPTEFRKALASFGVKSGVNPIIRRFQDAKSGNVAYERFLEYFDQARNASSVRSASLHRENTLSATDIGSSPLQSAMSSLSLVASPSDIPSKPNQVGVDVHAIDRTSKSDRNARKLDMMGTISPQLDSSQALYRHVPEITSALRKYDVNSSGLLSVDSFRKALGDAGIDINVSTSARELLHRSMIKKSDVNVENANSESDSQLVDCTKFLTFLDSRSTVGSTSLTFPSEIKTNLSDSTLRSPADGRKRPISPPCVPRSVALDPITGTPKSKIELVRDRFIKVDPDETGAVPEDVFIQVIKSVNPSASNGELQNLVSNLKIDDSSSIDYRSFLSIASHQPVEAISSKEELNSLISNHPSLSGHHSVQPKNDLKSHVFEDIDSDEAERRSQRKHLTSIQPGSNSPRIIGRNILAGETRQRSALDIRLDQLSQQIRDKVYGRSSDLASMFTSFDTDRSGKVDFNEFRHGLRTLGLRFEDEDVKLLCNRFDLDGDGEIDYSEFSTAISGPPLHEEMSKEERRLFTGGSKGAGESRLVSNQSDVFFFGENRNREDHRRGSRRSNFYKTMSSVELNLSTHESVKEQIAFRLLREEIMERANRKTDRIRDLFLSFDESGNGAISYDEFERGLRRLGVRASDEQVKKLVQIADSDRNGIIDYQEFVSIMKFEDSIHEDPYAKSAMELTKTRRKSVTPLAQSISDPLNQNPEAPRRDYVFASADGTFSLASGLSKRIEDNEITRRRTTEGRKILSPTERKDLKVRRKIVDHLYGKSSNLRDMFRKFDRTNDGSVSYEEFREGLEQLGVGLTIGEFERLVHHLDEQRSGTIDYAEFMNLMSMDQVDIPLEEGDRRTPEHMRSSLVGAGGQIAEDEENDYYPSSANRSLSRQDLLLKRKISDKLSSKSSSMKDLFMAMDEEKHGQVSYQQLRKGFEKLGVPLSDAEFHRITDIYDQDNTGSINYAEFTTLLMDNSEISAHSGPQRIRSKAIFFETEEERQERELRRRLQEKMELHASHLRNVFLEFDENGDGVLSESEFKNGARRLGIALSDEEYQRIRKQCDVDGNGSIDFTEFSKLFGSNLEIPLSLQSISENGNDELGSPLRHGRRFVGKPPGESSESTNSRIFGSRIDTSSSTESDGCLSSMSVQVDEHLPSRDSALSLDLSVTDSSSAIVPESSSFSASSVQSDMHPVVGNTLDETSSSPPLSDRRHVPALQLESLDVNHDSSPHPSFSSPKPVSVAKDPVARVLKREVIEATENHPIRLRESFRALDRTRKGSLSEKDFRRAFEVSGVHAPDWVLDRAVSLARSSQEEASCDYNQFIAALGFEVPNDHAYFQSGLDSLSRSVHGMPEGGVVMSNSPTVSENVLSGSPRRIVRCPQDSGDIIGHTTPVRSDDFSTLDRKKHVDYHPSPSVTQHPAEVSESHRLISGVRSQQQVAVVGSEQLQARAASAPRTPLSFDLKNLGGLNIEPISDIGVVRSIMKHAKTSGSLMSEFARDDHSGTGFVSHSDFHAGLHRVGVHLPGDRVIDLLKQFDPSGLGQVDYKKFSRSVALTDLATTTSTEQGAGISSGSRDRSHKLITRQRSCSEIKSVLESNLDSPTSTISSQKLFASKCRSAHVPDGHEMVFPKRHSRVVDSPAKKESFHITDPVDPSFESKMFDKRGKSASRPSDNEIFLSSPSEPVSPACSSPRSLSSRSDDPLKKRVKEKLYQSCSNLTGLFRSLDVENDGVLSAKEFQEGLAKMNLPLTEGQANRVVTMCGGDQSTGVSLEQFCKTFGVDHSPLGDQVTSIPGQSNGKSGSSSSILGMRGLSTSKFTAVDLHWGPYLRDDAPCVSPHSDNQDSLHPAARNRRHTLSQSYDLIGHRKDASGSSNGLFDSPGSPRSPRRPLSGRNHSSDIIAWTRKSGDPEEPPLRAVDPHRHEIGVVVERARSLTPEPRRMKNDWRTDVELRRELVRFSTPPPSPRRNPIL